MELYKRHKETLECKLTDDERAERSKTFAEKHQELRDLEDEKKRTDERLNSRIKILKQTVDDLSEIVISGVEKRDVECETLPDWDKLQMYVMRTDIWTEVPSSRRTMTVDEQQGELFKREEGETKPATEMADGETIAADSETNVRSFFGDGDPVETIDAAPAEDPTVIDPPIGWPHVGGEKYGAVTEEDFFTAPRCEKCGRIDGAHTADCGAIPYETYLNFAKAKGLSNPKAAARKMELKRDRDDEVRAWQQEVQAGRVQLGYPAYLMFAQHLGVQDPETEARVMLEGRERDAEVYAFIDAQQKAADEALEAGEREVRAQEKEARKPSKKRAKSVSGNARR
jgi:hypothetical protein